jgi:ABC-type xylose transport system permease subunit
VLNDVFDVQHIHNAVSLLRLTALSYKGIPTDGAMYVSAELEPVTAYDPATGKFSSAGSMGDGRQQQTATLLPDGRVFIAGGYWSDGQNYRALSSTEMFDPTAGQFSSLSLPFLTGLPVVGWLFDAFLAVGPIALTMLVSVIVLQLLLHRSRWGLRTKAVGEHPKAAETVGIDVIKLRYRNVILGGIFAGLGGAYLTMEFGACSRRG